jgi:hypothetical protein
MANEKEYLLDLFGKTIVANEDQKKQLDSNLVDGQGNLISRSLIEETNEVIGKFDRIIESVDQALLDTIEQANELLNAKVQSYRDRISAGVRTDRTWFTDIFYTGFYGLKVATATTSLGTYTAGIRTEYLYAVSWHDYTYENDFPYRQISGITTVGIATTTSYVGASEIQVGFGSLGSENQIHLNGELVRHYNVVGVTTLNFSGGITTTGIGSTAASFTSVANLTYPDTLLIANQEIIAIAGVAGTIVGFGTEGEFRGFDGTGITTHADGTEFQILKINSGITTLSGNYPESLAANLYVDQYPGGSGAGNTYTSLLTGLTVEPKKYLKVNTFNNNIGVSSGDYIGVGTELFYVTGITTSLVEETSTTIGVGTFVGIVRSIPVTYNIGTESFPVPPTGFRLYQNSYQTALDRGVSQATIDAADLAVSNAVAAASTVSDLANSRAYLVNGLNSIRTERLNYRMRKFAYELTIVTANEENARISAASTFLADPAFTSYMP